MCLAIPAKVIYIEEDRKWALVDIEGSHQRANISLLSKLQKGDYVLLHAGFAIQVINPKQALETLKLWRELT